MKRSLLLLSLAVLAFAAPSFAQYLDQSSPYTDEGFWAMELPAVWQQEVTVGMAGQLAELWVYFDESDPFQSANVFVNKGPVWQSEPYEIVGTYVSHLQGEGWYRIDVSTFNLNFSADEKFVIGIEALTGGELWIGGSANPGSYDAGALWLNGNVIAPDADLAFATYVVPEPATVLLLGLGGLGLLRRRRLTPCRQMQKLHSKLS